MLSRLGTYCHHFYFRWQQNTASKSENDGRPWPDHCYEDRCACVIIFPSLSALLFKMVKKAKCQISTARQRVETHQPLLALTRHLCSLFLGVELPRPQSWRDLAARTKKAEEEKCVQCKTSVRTDPEMSTLRGNVARRLWPIAPGHHSDASSSTDGYDEEEEEREPLTSVSLEGIQLKGIVQASKQWTNSSSDSMEWRWAVTLLTPFCNFFLPAILAWPPRGTGKTSRVYYGQDDFSSMVCFCLQLTNSVQGLGLGCLLVDTGRTAITLTEALAENMTYNLW